MCSLEPFVCPLLLLLLFLSAGLCETVGVKTGESQVG